VDPKNRLAVFSQSRRHDVVAATLNRTLLVRARPCLRDADNDFRPRRNFEFTAFPQRRYRLLLFHVILLIEVDVPTFSRKVVSASSGRRECVNRGVASFLCVVRDCMTVDPSTSANGECGTRRRFASNFARVIKKCKFCANELAPASLHARIRVTLSEGLKRIDR
jgi:hypothetical protein